MTNAWRPSHLPAPCLFSFCLALLCLQSAAFSYIPHVSDNSPGNHGDGGGDPANFQCELDPKLLNEVDFAFFLADIERAWGTACGRNRGVFVLDPPDGHTYDCGNLPKEWGVSSVGDITNLTKTSTKVAVDVYAKLVDSMYKTTTGKTADACDFDALTVLTCSREEPWRRAPWVDRLNAPIRAVNIGGLFVLERWILPNFVEWGPTTGIIDQHSFSRQCDGLGVCQDIKDHWKNWYSGDDFKAMKEVGLNSVRIPVGWWYFAMKGDLDPSPYVVPDEDLYDPQHPITSVIRWAKEADLMVIIDLHGAPGSQNGLDNSGVTSRDPNDLVWGETWMYNPENVGDTVRILAVIAQYINHIEDALGLDNIMALELLNEPWAHLDLGRVREFYALSIEAIRMIRPLLPVILHDSFRGPMWPTLLKDFPYHHIYMDTHIYHGFNKADVASDTAQGDRQKMYVHERMACSYTAMLRYETCAALPVFVGEWSLAIDNCMPHLDMKFANYGQCDHMHDRSGSWWKTHIRSFAMRQIAMYEREMGWSFWTWKLDDYAEKNEVSATYWSFHLAVKNGLIDTNYPEDACLHPPEEDYMKPLELVASRDSQAETELSGQYPLPSPVSTPASAAASSTAAGAGGVASNSDVVPQEEVEEQELSPQEQWISGSFAAILIGVGLCGMAAGAVMYAVIDQYRSGSRGSTNPAMADMSKSGYDSIRGHGLRGSEI
ncbi:unnamed protein product [Discosporangium mesarthrocarpum]